MFVDNDDKVFPGERRVGLQRGEFRTFLGQHEALLGVWKWPRLLKGERSFAQKGDWGEGCC